jgi:hypothetical protein
MAKAVEIGSNKLPLPAPFDSAYALLDLDSPRMWEAVI